MNDMDELHADQARIVAMPGRVASAKLARLHRTAKVFSGNARALLEHLKRMDDLEYMLATTSDRQASEEFFDEMERHLHNYVAAAQSRVEHFRRFARTEWPEGSPFREEYQRRVEEEFDTSPLHNFVTDLRNLILHVRLPVSTTMATWWRDGARTFQVMLDSADLLHWGRLSSQAREYIEASGESVDLGRAVSTYTDEIIAFDQWVAESFVREHQEEMRSYKRALREHQARFRRRGVSDHPETP